MWQNEPKKVTQWPNENAVIILKNCRKWKAQCNVFQQYLEAEKKKFEKKFLTLQINVQNLSAKWTTGLYFRSSTWLFQVQGVCTIYLQTNIVICKQTWCTFSYVCKCYNHILQSQSYYALTRETWNWPLLSLFHFPV
jgi:hypothetical protein